jgi:hypothetical protein
MNEKTYLKQNKGIKYFVACHHNRFVNMKNGLIENVLLTFACTVTTCLNSVTEFNF